MSGAWLGIDLGTQGVKALVVDDDGRVLGRGTAPLTSHRSGERHEQDPEQWWSATCAAVRAAGRTTPLVQVQGLAVDATSGTVTVLDGRGRTTGPGLMYDDSRAVEQAARVNEVGARQWAAAGYQRMQRSWGLPKLVWLLSGDRARPETRLAHQSDVVNRRLVGGDVATDTSNALKTGVDLTTGSWPTAVLDALGVPTGAMPPVVTPGVVLGGVCVAAAGRTGLPVGTPVVAGMTDGCAAQLASGATRRGDWSSVLGTTLVLKGVADAPLSDPHGVVYCHRSPDGGWLPGGASSVGAGLVSRELPDVDLDALAVQAAERLPTDLLRYPLVSPGERFPFVAPDAVDVVTRRADGPAETLAALMQGTAYAERLCLDYLAVLGAPVGGRLVLSGGASRNRVWSQLRADVLGRPVDLLAGAEPATGMAVLARAGVSAGAAGLIGTTTLAEVAEEMIHRDHTLDPRVDVGARHEDGYRRLVGLLVERGWLDARVAADLPEAVSR